MNQLTCSLLLSASKHPEIARMMSTPDGTRSTVKERVLSHVLSSVPDIPRDIIVPAANRVPNDSHSVGNSCRQSWDFSVPPLAFTNPALLHYLRAADDTSLGTSEMRSPDCPGALKPLLIN